MVGFSSVDRSATDAGKVKKISPGGETEKQPKKKAKKRKGKKGSKTDDGEEEEEVDNQKAKANDSKADDEPPVSLLPKPWRLGAMHDVLERSAFFVKCQKHVFRVAWSYRMLS